MGRHLRRLLLLLVLSFVALQAAFVLRIALMAFIDPQSTTFERSEIRRLLAETGSEVVTPTPEEFASFTRGELERWRKMSQDFGIKYEP